MAIKLLEKDEMAPDEFGRAYKYYESQLTGVEDAIWYLHARGIQGVAEEEDDLNRLEAKLNRLKSKAEMEFDWFLSSDISVQPPTEQQVNDIAKLCDKVEKLTNQQKLAGATLDLLNELATTASPLMKP